MAWQSLRAVGQRIIKGFQFPPHLQILQRKLFELIYGDINRLLIKLPVRHGKSTICSHILPTWYACSFPDRNIILSSYSSEFSAEWCSKVRDSVQEHGKHITGVEVDRRYKSQDFWKVKGYGGTIRSAGTGGAIAGKGGHLLVADDLIKDHLAAASPLQRHRLWTWFHSEFLTRLEPTGKVVVVQSVRHPADIVSTLPEENQDLPDHEKWHELIMPAISVDEQGNEHALWPDRYSLEKLHDIRSTYERSGESYLWECLYQQNPTGDTTLLEWPASLFDGVLFDHLPPELSVVHKLLSVDPSLGSDARLGDYASFLHGLVDSSGTIWLDDVFLERYNSEQVEDHAVAWFSTKFPDAGVVESNAGQEIICRNIKKKCQERGLTPSLWPHVNSLNKEVRIRLSLTPLLNQRRIRIRNTPHGRLLLAQLKEFPTGAHDDGPDSLDLLVQLLKRIQAEKRKTPPKRTVLRVR